MITEEDIAFAHWCAQSSLDSRRMEQIYVMILNGVEPDAIGFRDADEEYFYQIVKKDVDETVIPDGVSMVIPSDL